MPPRAFLLLHDQTTVERVAAIPACGEISAQRQPGPPLCVATKLEIQHRTDQGGAAMRFAYRRSLVPRYYFHVCRGQLTVIDRVGMELAGDIEAALEAARRGREIAKSQALRGIPTQGGLIIVEDQWDQV